MVEKRSCTFCGADIEPGTGKLYIKRDGTRYMFCSSKCQKNMIDLKRVNRKTRWTKAYEKATGPTPPKASNQPEPATAGQGE